jgi:hypothetical protein
MVSVLILKREKYIETWVNYGWRLPLAPGAMIRSHVRGSLGKSNSEQRVLMCSNPLSNVAQACCHKCCKKRSCKRMFFNFASVLFRPLCKLCGLQANLQKQLDLFQARCTRRLLQPTVRSASVDSAVTAVSTFPVVRCCSHPAGLWEANAGRIDYADELLHHRGAGIGVNGPRLEVGTLCEWGDSDCASRCAPD